MGVVAMEKTEEDANIKWTGAGIKLKDASCCFWGNNQGADDFGFAALPGGKRVAKDGSYVGYEEFGAWWVSDDGAEDGAKFSLQLDRGFDASFGEADDQYSVRCVREK